MLVYGIDIPDKEGLTNIDIEKYAADLGIPHFRGVFMKDTLPRGPPHKIECGVVNMDSSKNQGTHWCCYARLGDNTRIYFDSFGQNVLSEVAKYLKSATERKYDIPVIARNTDVVQTMNTHVCGHLCLFVLTSLMREHLPYQQVLNHLRDGHSQAYW